MKNKKFLLLPLLLCAVTSCSGGGDNPPPEPVKHTFNFVGENCFLKDSAGAEITSAIVNDGDSLTYTIFVKEEDKYKLPGDITVTEGIDYTYTPSKNELKINNITKDVSVTAKALEKDKIYIGYTMSHIEGCKWEGPYSVDPKTEIVANAVLADGYTLSQENITVLVTGVGLLTKGYTYNSTSKKLTIEAEYVVGDIGIIGQPQKPGPGPEPTKEYEIKFNMKNATSNFPAKQSLNDSILGTITANKGYRCPTKEEVAENEWLVKNAPGSIYHFKYDEFLYYPFEEEGVSSAYLYIDAYYLNRTTPANSVEINGEAIELVEVKFSPGEGQWVDGPEESKKEVRVAYVDKNTDTLSDAAEKCGANVTPSYGQPGWNFDGWYNNKEEWVPTAIPLTGNLEVHAKYKQIEYTIYTDNVRHAKFTNLPEFVYYHQPIGGASKPVIITPDQGFALPSKEDVKVQLKRGQDFYPIEFTYKLNDDNTATFEVAKDIIDADVHISLVAEEFISISFNPNGGSWPSQEAGTKTLTAKVAKNTTYEDALKTVSEGNPKIKGKEFRYWEYEGQKIVPSHIIAADGMTVTAHYEEGGTGDFRTDTWANVVRHADEGTLVDTYGNTMYLGAERSLFIGTTEYKVRIIDFQHDVYMKSGKQVVSSISFEFENLIDSGEYGHCIGPSGQTQNSNNWVNSTYRSELSNFYTQICANNEGFESKAAVKSTLQGKDGDPLPISKIETEEHFFPMSGKEIGLSESNGQLNETKYTQGASEGFEIYQYYMSNADRRKKLINETDYSEYWLRSPHVYHEDPETQTGYDSGNSYYIKTKDGTSKDYAGAIATGGQTEYPKGYMVAFCI